MLNKLRALVKRRKFQSFYAQFIKENDLAFDVGANVGSRTSIFLSLGARVISIEQVEESFRALQKKYQNNKKVDLLPIAIGSKPGVQTIHVSNYSEVCTLSETFIEKYKDQDEFDITWNEKRNVKVKTLDQLIDEFGLPVFCKIDVEGFEIEVLRGLSVPIPLISFEYNARLKNLALDCINELSKFENLQFNFSPYESMAFSLDRWLSAQQFCDFIESLNLEVQTGDIYVISEI